MPRRGRIELMQEILKDALKETPKTRLMYMNNLSFTCCNYYIKYLLDKELIAEISTPEGRTLYKTTKRGQEFLEVVGKLKEFVDFVGF